MTTSEKESEVVSRTLELLLKDPAHFDSLEIAACRDELLAQAQINDDPSTAFRKLEETLSQPFSNALALEPSGTERCPLCNWLYDWYQDGSPSLRHFVLSFIPVLVWNYTLRYKKRTNAAGYEACMLLIYNDILAERRKDGKPPPLALPSLTVPSSYHAPGHHHRASLLANMQAHMCLDGVHDTVYAPKCGAVRPEEQTGVCATVLDSLVHQLATYTHTTHIQFCSLSLRLAGTGYNWASVQGSGLEETGPAGMGGDTAEVAPVCLSPLLLRVLVRGLGFCIHNKNTDLPLHGRRAAQLLKKRCTFEMLEEGMLLTQALLAPLPL
mmetsp:Transcript_27656/g.46290  ORF Transcript_27656/g.46290 Transcript_27656/m.46290 type:complete len:325 (-) Transcript_27656:451-1425(-)|eukprot:CAMPEP_0198229984 /NCGR_PEP_ID=MMETSP1445-20131203/114409_1 /TAXON_ID=36898 /ORGANISM="Pyramimonas sp., Strain CCMP2087" /LENGTH=324 /DNA_ID=CAMNT_0043910469 /DNA_START=297 /DNA_END=1271 /DNA_ORIENTATION=+